MMANLLSANLITLAGGLGLSRNPAHYVPALTLLIAVAVVAVLFTRFSRPQNDDDPDAWRHFPHHD